MLIYPWPSDDHIGAEARLKRAGLVVNIRFSNKILAVSIGESVNDRGLTEWNKKQERNLSEHLTIGCRMECDVWSKFD